jgi:hypothetical protein
VHKIDPNSNEPLTVYWNSFVLSTLLVNNIILPTNQKIFCQ